MVNNVDTLKSDNMLYYNKYPDYLLATGNVTYKKPGQFLKCDSLYYWTDIDSGYAIGSVKLNNDNHSINTDYIRQFNKQKIDCTWFWWSIEISHTRINKFEFFNNFSSVKKQKITRRINKKF